MYPGNWSKQADCVQLVEKIDWVELRSSMNRENMVQLSGADQQQAAQKVVVIVERIAKERGISEEEAYKMFLKGEY